MIWCSLPPAAFRGTGSIRSSFCRFDSGLTSCDRRFKSGLPGSAPRAVYRDIAAQTQTPEPRRSRFRGKVGLRGEDLNLRPSGYEAKVGEF